LKQNIPDEQPLEDFWLHSRNSHNQEMYFPQTSKWELVAVTSGLRKEEQI